MKMVCTDLVTHCTLLSSPEWKSRVRGVRVTASSGCCPSPDPQKSHTPLVLKTNEQNKNYKPPAETSAETQMNQKQK